MTGLDPQRLLRSLVDHEVEFEEERHVSRSRAPTSSDGEPRASTPTPARSMSFRPPPQSAASRK